MGQTIEERFSLAARDHRGRTAIADGNRTMTYHEVEASADQGAARLHQAGLRENEPVLVPVSNVADDIPAFLAVWRAGGIVVPVHRSSPKPVVAALSDQLGNRFVLDGEIEQCSSESPPSRTPLAGVGTIVFTSGSTGVPKGVVLSRARAASKLSMIERMTGWQAGENAFVGLQLTFSFGQWATWLTLLNGGTLHLRGRFDPAEVSGYLAGGAIDRFPAVPTMLRKLLDSHSGSGFDGDIMAGGEPLLAPLGLQVRGAFPKAGLGDIYGLTETGTSDFFVQPRDYDRCAGTIGHAGDEIEWRLDQESGELQIRSPWGMLGYLDAPDLTKGAFEEDWFRTGDLATLDDSGAVRLVGRIKDLILRSGNKIAPLEVETVFLRHADIADALATGVTDPDCGEATHLAIVPREGATLVREELRAWATDYLDRYKIPDVIHLVAILPTGSTGKADRQVLRRLIEGGLMR